MSRRKLIGAAGAGALGLAALGAGVRGGGQADGPNVLLIVIDTLRADHLGAYGNEVVHTPNIDLLAAQGTRFTRFYPEAMPTLPMRRTIMTGRRIFPFRGWRPWQGLGKSPGWSPIMPDERTVVDAFNAAGYSTSYVTDNPFLGFAPALEPLRDKLDRVVPVPGYGASIPPERGAPEDDARRVLPEYMLGWHNEVAEMRNYLLANGGAGGLDIDEPQTAAARVFGAGILALRQVNPRRRLGIAGRPFFLVVDSFDPHEPWAIPRRYRALYGDPDVPFIGDITYRTTEALSDDELERLRATYKGAVSLVDAHVGRLLDELDRLGLAESTTVALVSDHGIHLGERDWIGKSAWLLTPELIHVPLIVRTPGGAGGHSSDWLASTPDVPPTLLASAGLRPPRWMEGDDLSPILAGGAPPHERDLAYGGYSNDFYARDDRWALISDNRMVGSQLYDLRDDPDERRDVSADRPDVVARMRRRLLARLDAPPPFYPPERFELPPRALEV